MFLFSVGGPTNGVSGIIRQNYFHANNYSNLLRVAVIRE